MIKNIEGDVVDIRRIRQRIVYLVMYAFCTGGVFAFTIAKYRQSPTNLDGGYILICGVLLLGTILQSWMIWARLKELEPPRELTANRHVTR